MKKVVSGDILTTKMIEAVHLITDTVKTTLGPKGQNVIIDHSDFQPFITNDGVTIAENIESEDETLQTILTLTKEASINTNNDVGDGTTTTLVLLRAIFDKGLEMVKNGTNPIILKRKLNESLLEVKEMILRKNRKPSKEELTRIASISANDYEIGKMVSDAYFKVGLRSGIELLEHDEVSTKLVHGKGYKIPTRLASSYFLSNEDQVKLENSYLLLMQNNLGEIENIALILNTILKENRPLVVIAEDYRDSFIQEILALREETNANIYLLKIPEYGMKQQEILKDLRSISDAKITKCQEEIRIQDLGVLKAITLNKKDTIFSYQKNKNTEWRKKEILKQIKASQNDLEVEWNQRRYAMFQKGIVEIYVGAQTTTERREKKMRFLDALCAIDSASFGILPGSGIILLEISEQIEKQEIGFQIFADALKKPFYQILENAGIDSEDIYQKIHEKEFKYLYNVLEENYELVENSQVVDATKVVIEALNNAVSIASMLLTTNHLIINEYQNERNKLSGYNEM